LVFVISEWISFGCAISVTWFTQETQKGRFKRFPKREKVITYFRRLIYKSEAITPKEGEVHDIQEFEVDL
jgi:hypothetical protein